MARDKASQSIPLQGGVDTYREKALLDGRFSKLQNWRHRNPGLQQRKGQIVASTVADGTVDTISIYGHSKAHKTELRTYAQKSDGSLQEGTNNLPTITTGVFGSDVLAAVAGAEPASYSNINDMLLYSDKVRQHQVYTGDGEPVLVFVVYKGAAAIPDIPVIGEDYSIEVTDGQSGTVAILDSLSTLAAFDAIYICTPVPMQDLNFTVSAVNGTASVLQAKYWKGTYAAVSGISDGTSSGGASMAQSGAVTWTAPTDELPHYQYGRSGFWYQLSLASGAMDAEVEVSAVTYDSPWQDLVNVWDGVLTDPAEVQVYDDSKNDAGNEGYSIYGSASVFMGRLATADFVYWNSIDRLAGVYLDAGATPNIVKAAVTGSSNISFFSSGSTSLNDWMVITDANFLDAGFEEGQSITIGSTAGGTNDLTDKIIQVTSNTIFVAPGLLTDQADQSATITFDVSPTTLDNIEVWTGNAWAAVTSMTDSTEGLTKSGFVTWDRTSQTPQLTQFNQTQYKAYWYRMSFSKALSNNVNISIQNMPYFDISQLGLGRTNTVWKERGLYTADLFSKDIYVSASGNPTFLNGTDFTILEPGDGRANATRKMLPFYSELIVWQEEVGERGGCVTLFEGFDPATFGKFLISTEVGIINSKAAVVVDGVLVSTKTDTKIQTMAYWISREGIFRTEGTKARAISDDVRNFFDPTDSNSLRRGYENKHYMHHNKADGILEIGLVTGSSATVPNTFLTYDLASGVFGTDVRGQGLSCAANIDAASGDIPVLQIGGGSNDGFVYQLNTTDDDVSTAIDADLELELDGKGDIIQLEELTARMKALASGDLDASIAVNGNTSFTNIANSPLSMIASTTNDAHRRHREPPGHFRGDHLSLRFRNNESGVRPYLLDVGGKLKVLEVNN